MAEPYLYFIPTSVSAKLTTESDGTFFVLMLRDGILLLLLAGGFEIIVFFVAPLEELQLCKEQQDVTIKKVNRVKTISDLIIQITAKKIAKAKARQKYKTGLGN